jgi:AP-1-like transcription factor
MDLHQSTDTSQQQSDQKFAAWEVAQSTAGQQNNYLDSNQQDLLLAALNSQAGSRQNTQSQAVGSGVAGVSFAESQLSSAAKMNGADGNGVFISPTEAEFDNFGDYTPELDYLDDGFDFENADLGGEMIGALPGGGDSTEDLSGTHEKRKNPDGTESGGDAKRQETENGEKGAKKPGRKPLTSEPTTVCLVRFV